jgi:hypothetical protein
MHYMAATPLPIYMVLEGMAMRIFKKNEVFQKGSQVFLKARTEEEIVSNGECVLLPIYGHKSNEDLNSARYRIFQKKVSTFSRLATHTCICKVLLAARLSSGTKLE